MKEQARRLIGYLNLLGIKIDSASFESRVKAQKLAYIIQSILGKQIYSDFNFYIRGPYSHELARDYFSSIDDFANGRSGYKPANDEYEKVERAKPILKGMNDTDMEIAASLIFLENGLGMDEGKAEEELKARKPHLKIEDIWRNANTVKRLLLTEKHREALMKLLKDELEGWDSISNESLNRF